MKTIVLDRRVIVHHGISSILNERYHFEVKGCTDAGMALSHAQSGEYDVMFVQIPEYVADVGEFTSILPTICVSDSTKPETLQDAISLGASGYLLISDPEGEFWVAVEMATQFGKLRARASEVQSLFNKLEERRKIAIEAGQYLTDRDRDVLELLVKGWSNDEIADELCVATGTVRNRVSSILGKTDNPNRTALALWAVDMGVVERES